MNEPKLTDEQIEQHWRDSPCPHKSTCRWDFGCDGCCQRDDKGANRSHAGTLGL